MQEMIAQVFSYVWGIWRFRWLALCVTWVVALGGWLFVRQMPEAYVASARIFVDTNNVLRPLLQGLAIQPNTQQRISMMSRTLLSRPNLEKVARMTDLDLSVNTDLEKERLLGEMRRSISLGGDSHNTSLYSIQVKDRDRETAKRITQALMTVFIETSLSDKRQDSSGAQEFLDEQINEVEKRLIEAEDRLAAFKQRHVGVLPGEGGGYYSRLNQAKAALSAAQLELKEAENRKLELQRQIDGEEPVFLSGLSGGIVGPADSPLNRRIQSLNAKKDSLLTKYTELHPEVRQIDALIADLEAEQRGQITKAPEGSYPDFAGLSSSPVYQGMRSMLASTDAQVAQLTVRVNEYENRVSDLEGMVDRVPLIEAELKQLDRDYSIIGGQYSQLVQRREAARLSEDVEQKASDVTFRVIDPPFVPALPSEPNKLLLNSLVLVFAVGAGAALALLASLIKPVVVDQQSLNRLTGLPLLGYVTLLPAPEQQKRERMGLVAYSSMAAVLVIVFVGINVRLALMML